MKKIKLTISLLFIIFFQLKSFGLVHCNLLLSESSAGACGNVCINAGTGIPPYSFQWLPVNDTTQCSSGLPSGYYTVTVYDATGCWDTISFVVTNPFNVTVTQIGNSSCPCYNISASGGNSPYSYIWSTGSTASSLCSAQAGTYALEIVDAMGCIADTSFTTTSSNPFSLYTTSTPALCRNGTAIASVIGGTPPFHYQWSTSVNDTDSTATGLHANQSYQVTVSDDSGCVQSEYVYIGTNSNLSSGINATPDTCSHGVGTLTGYALSGIPPYHYLWNTNDTITHLYNLHGGSYYTFTVADDSGCTSHSYQYLNNFSPVFATYSIVQPSCTSYTGKIILNTSGGIQPYNYYWNTNPVQSGDTATGLAVGNYSCLITDQRGCTANISAHVTDSSSFTVSATSTVDTCYHGTGQVYVSTQNGVPPFTYQWNYQSPVSISILSNLHPGWNQCIVTDQALCVRKAKAYVDYFSPLHVYVTPHNSSCIFTADGSATAIVTGATPPLHFSWAGDTSHTATNLLQGYYSCSVTDSIGCNSYQTFYVGYNAVLPCAVTIEGTVFNDTNMNCIRDAGDVSLSNVMIECLPSGGYKWTDNSGQYKFYLPPGNYHVRQPQLPPWHYAVCPAADYYDTLPIVGMIDTNNFADIGNAIDLNLNCYAVTPPIPGFTHTQSIYYQNQGTRTVTNAFIKIKHDPLLTFLSSSPAAANYDALNHIITVNLPSLNPMGSYSNWQGQVLIYYSVPSNLAIGTGLSFIDTILPVAGDTVIYNNYENCFETVVGSYDPNSIEVSPKGTAVQGYISTNDSVLDYIVRFQNTGNYYAHNVVVKIQIDNDLDLSTFEANGSSFPYSVEITPAGLATFSFLNILLPDSTFDELHSHGYFAFSIRQKTGLLPGTEITGTANIYFDYNSPVVTNSVLNTIIIPVTVHGIENMNEPFSVFPNPVRNQLSVMGYSLTGNVVLEVFNVMGEKIHAEKYQARNSKSVLTIDVSSITSGIYFIRLTSDNGSAVKKFVKD